MNAILADLPLVLAVLLVGGAVGLFAYMGTVVFRRGYERYEDRYVAAVGKQLEDMFVTVPPEQILYMGMASGVFAFLVGVFLSAPAPLPAKPPVILIFTIVGFLIPKLYLKRMEKRRIQMFEEQLVDGLTTISNCLKSGFSFPQALEMLVQEGLAPLSQEFSLVLREYRLGRSLDEALSHLLKRVPSEDLDIAITAILTTREIGGNLADVFDQIAEVIRERSRIQGKIRALTSQGKLQGIIVGVMPLLLGVAVHFVDPELMRPMYTTLLGWGFLVVILIFETIGGFLIKKIVTIDI